MSFTETYAEDGSLIEARTTIEQVTFGGSYEYRSDGQVDTVELFDIDENGDRAYSGERWIYEYGDDDRVDVIRCYDRDSEEDCDCNVYFGECQGSCCRGSRAPRRADRSR